MDVIEPAEIVDEAAVAISNLLPKKSAHLYEKEYRIFCSWRTEKKVMGISESIMLAYFSEKIKTIKVSTVWSLYSKLKATISLYENVDISKFSRLISRLKKENSGYIPKKSKIFERNEIQTFLSEAPDEEYLLIKVYVILAVSGGCRGDEMHRMKINHIDDRDSVLVVEVPDTKTNKTRKFAVINEMCGVNAIEMFRKYRKLRPSNISHNSLFIGFRDNKCSVQPVGINNMAKFSYKIASYLKLSNPECYTGHCFRKTSASLLANTGADILELKRHGEWKSSTVAEDYIKGSVQNEINLSRNVSKDYIETSYRCQDQNSSLEY